MPRSGPARVAAPRLDEAQLDLGADTIASDELTNRPEDQAAGGQVPGDASAGGDELGEELAKSLAAAVEQPDDGSGDAPQGDSQASSATVAQTQSGAADDPRGGHTQGSDADPHDS